MEKEQTQTFDGIRSLFERSIKGIEIRGKITPLSSENDLGEGFELKIGKENVEGVYLSAGGILLYDASEAVVRMVNDVLGAPNFIYNLQRKDKNKVMAMISRQTEGGEVSSIREMIETPKEDDSPLETS